MQRIISPLRPGDRNEAVANLQDALRLFAECQRITLDPSERDSLLDGLGHKRREQIYDAATHRLVILFRIQHSLNNLDWVDDPTAAVLNDLPRELGAQGIVGGRSRSSWTSKQRCQNRRIRSVVIDDTFLDRTQARYGGQTLWISNFSWI